MGRKFKDIEFDTTVGIEFEGYTKDIHALLDDGVRHCEFHRDYSLSNAWGQWEDRRKPVGIEIVTEPFTALNTLDEVMQDILDKGWNVGRSTAGTHVHVGVEDYTMYEKMKLSIFMREIEDAMFLTVKKYRRTKDGERNRYADRINTDMMAVKNYIDSHGGLNSPFMTRLGGRGTNLLERVISTMRQDREVQYSTRTRLLYPSRYEYVNIWKTRHETVEFRLFHATNNLVEAKKFALLAYHIVKFVKHSTLSQLFFVSNSINEAETAEDMLHILGTSIGLPYELTVKNKELASSMRSVRRVIGA